MLKRIILRLLWRLENTIGTSSRVEKRRRILSRYFNDILGATVAYGPFRGLKLAKEMGWSKGDRAAILFGLYEKEVLASLASLSGSYESFINLGAGDGYYAVGAVSSGMFRTAYCYEANEGSRKLVRKNAGMNAIEDRIHIFGSAAKGFHRDIPSVVLASAVLLVDIEGSEFDLLDEAAFMAFQNSVIFIELHEWFFEDGSIRLQKLKEDASATHRLFEMTTGARDLSQFAELDRLSDSDRWLVCSEGRPRRMSWLRLDPWTATSG